MPKRLALTSFEDMYGRIAARPFRGAWQAIAIVVFGISLIAGVLVRTTDPTHFHSVWAGMWWGIQTVTTVGYGDIVPTSLAGRLTGVVVMLAGISFITVTAGAITSEFVEAARRRRQATQEEGPELIELRGLRAQVSALEVSLEQLRRDVRAELQRPVDGPADS